MKVLIFGLALFAIAQAKTAIDWDSVYPLHVEPNGLGPKRGSFRRPTGRITGGDEVEPHSLPYQVGLFIPTEEGTAFCGGSLLSETVVVTAAHCGELSNNITVVLGAHNIREEEDTQVQIQSSDVQVHPEWDRLLLINDIALIILSEPVELNENIQVVKLPEVEDRNNSFVGEIAKASGWGKDSDAATSISPVLRSVDVEVADNLICNVYYLGIIEPSHICTDGAGGKSTCNGDSGGPLIVDGVLGGIVSFGISLGCEIGWPPVYTRVTEYVVWIQDSIAKIESMKNIA